MAAILQIKQGEDLEFAFSRGGLPLDGWICTIFVKQYPKDVPTITREIAVDPNNPLIWTGFLNSTETAGLKVGLWWITGILTNDESDEEAQDPIRFQVSPSWDGSNPMPISELNEYMRKGRDVNSDTPLSIVHQGNLIRVDTTEEDIEVELPASSTLPEDYRVVVAKVSTDANKINVTRDAGDTINKVASNAIIDTPFFLVTFFISKDSTDWTMAVVNIDLSSPGPIGNVTPGTIDGTVIKATTSIEGNAGAAITQFDDDDDLTANSATRAITQQAAKAYIDSMIAAAANLLLAKAANLSDVASASSSRNNLGLGSAALLDEGTDPGDLIALNVNSNVPSANLPASTETIKGAAEIATQAETDAGTDDTRIVTPEKLANFPFPGGAVRAAFAYPSANISVPTSTFTILNFDLELYDDDDIHDIVTNNSRLTVPTGVTLIKLNAQTAWNTVNVGRRELYIRKNGSGTGGFLGVPFDRKPSNGDSAAVMTKINSAPVQVVGGDFFEVQVWHNRGANLDILASSAWPTYFSMEIME